LVSTSKNRANQKLVGTSKNRATAIPTNHMQESCHFQNLGVRGINCSKTGINEHKRGMNDMGIPTRSGYDYIRNAERIAQPQSLGRREGENEAGM